MPIIREKSERDEPRRSSYDLLEKLGTPMKRILPLLVALLLLAAVVRVAPAQSSPDFSAGYGYLPDGYGKLAAAQTNLPPATSANLGSGPRPTPIPDYEPMQVDGDFFAGPGEGVGWQIVGDYLYIRPSNAEVAYAQVVDGTTGLPIGRTGVANPFYDIGFRVSGARALGDSAAIGISYTYFDNTVNSNTLATDNPQLLAPPASQVRSLVFHPAAPNAGIQGDTAIAEETMRFQLGDVDYKAALVSGPRYCANVFVGARFVDLDQHFDSSITDAAGISELMFTDVRFEGGGVRLGFDGERQSPSSGFLIYGKGAMSFVAGTVRARYSEFNVANPFVVDLQSQSNRMLTMLDFELGAGWANVDGTIRVTGGWMVSGWYNTVKPSKFIQAVQTSNPGILDSPLENVLAFDGLVFRVEWRF